MKIKELKKEHFDDHSFLEPEDSIYYMKDYSSRAGYSLDGNSLILNLKKGVERKESDEWEYKEKAISFIADSISYAMDTIPPPLGRTVYWVPVPPSKVKSDPLYDDRICRIINEAIEKTTSHKHVLAEIVIQNHNRDASSTSLNKRIISKLVENYLIKEIPNYNIDTDIIIIFDDVLTTGCHFKAVEAKILSIYPDAKISGIFVARRVIDSSF